MSESAIKLTGRGKVALGAAAITMGLGAWKGINLATAGFEHLDNASKDNVHQASEVTNYSQVHLADKVIVDGRAPKGTTSYLIHAPEKTPTDVARDMHAKAGSIALVAAEVSGQEGGETHMQLGDTVVIPDDQLQHTNQTVTAIKK